MPGLQRERCVPGLVAAGENQLILDCQLQRGASISLDMFASIVWLALALAFELAAKAAADQAPSATELKLRMSWGYQSKAKTPFFIRLVGQETSITDVTPEAFEPGDRFQNGIVEAQAGGGDTDALSFRVRFAPREIHSITNLQTIWSYLLSHSDDDTAKRLRADPAYRPDPRKLTVQLNADETKGFTVTIDQLLTQRSFWIPELDLFVSAGEPPASFEEHQQAIEPFRGRRILDQVRQQPEASYEQFCRLWEDMGNPNYHNSAAPPPGHIVCLSWDSSLSKFGVDRIAGIRNDLGNPEHFSLSFDFVNSTAWSNNPASIGFPNSSILANDLSACWKTQRLQDGLPIISTRFEKPGLRCEVEQFAYPLNGPIPNRRGDLAMVLLEKLRLTETTGSEQTISLLFNYEREHKPSVQQYVELDDGLVAIEESSRALLTLQGRLSGGPDLKTRAGKTKSAQSMTVTVHLPADGTRELILKVPSPAVGSGERATLVALDYDRCRAETVKFWSDLLARGAQFEAPEPAVNELFRANLWHALRLPRRHGGNEPGVKIDLPYSNFAYDQRGAPWPVNQAVYVDYMIYDLRGYPDFSAEELASMFRDNQEPNGHVKGFANWGVYTPSMLYAVAQHYLLTGDRAAFEALLPATLRGLDWCLNEIHQAADKPGPARGLILAPLNDLSHEPRAWAFNQSYFFAGIHLLGRALVEIKHERAPECQAAARAMAQAVQRGFAHASMLAPLVQLRDHTWSPYVPADALTPRRLLDVWYPTDVDTGALHLARLQALDPNGALTTALLNDHEDNLYLNGWGMANEPVYNQQAMAYLWRDDVPAVVRAFYSMMACAFSHSVFEPVEHRWAWGQYFGPPSTDGAWFELYRHMLIHEEDDGGLRLLAATPKKWLENGKQIQVQRAPTFFGDVSFTIESRVAEGKILVRLEMPNRRAPKNLSVRLRHPDGKRISRVLVDGIASADFDPVKEIVRIEKPREKRCEIEAQY